MKELKNIILSAQNSDESSMMELITFFEPVIRKYTKLMNYDEDCRSELIMYFIELIRSLNLTKFRVLNNYTLINYIKQSLYHHYILISSGIRKKRKYENSYDSESITEWLGADYESTDKINDMMIDDMMKEHLTDREYICVKLIVIDCLSSNEAAKLLGITKQSANEAKLRALRKLKLLF